MPSGLSGRGAYRIIPKAVLLEEMRRVALLLKVKRLSQNTYRKHGRYFRGARYQHFGTWSQLCVEAGLRPTVRGFKCQDYRPCLRCDRRMPWYGIGQAWCKECRRSLRKQGEID